MDHIPVLYPMHLHGHFFQVGDAGKDTVVVSRYRGKVALNVGVDTPGSWLVH